MRVSVASGFTDTVLEFQLYTHFQTLSTTNAPFVCFTCYQHDQHVLTTELQSEVVSLKAEIIKLNELISCVSVSNVCVSTDNQSYSGTETRSHVSNKKSDRSPVTKELVSKHQATAYKSDSSSRIRERLSLISSHSHL